MHLVYSTDSQPVTIELDKEEAYYIESKPIYNRENTTQGSKMIG
jgi:hypothetical protein